ncbi:MAG: hydantoinase/oxoprolinase family protein, partial [Chloroflexi bacterium]|nr:hydantoinase/oxoprolinase family protein [Chloroflexota bacterium]
MPYMIGIDTGGTFTDCVIVDNEGRASSAKSPTTYHDLSEGILEAVRRAAERRGLTLQALLKDTILFCQASTIGTNALLTRSGAKTALLTTRGFEDIILMMRSKGRFAGLSEDQIKHVVKTRKPDPIVQRPLIKGVKERLDYKGRVLVSLDVEETRRIVAELVSSGVESIAVSLLWSFINPVHEKQIKDIIQEISPKTYVSIASDLAPKLGEYERTSTAVIDAYIGPVNHRFVSNLDSQLRKSGLGRSPLFSQGYGGAVSPEYAIKKAVGTLSSGPAAGVIASKYLAEQLGYEHVITTDVGGTSFDVGLIYKGEPALEHNPVVGQYDLLVPQIQVTSIGAGGGSIARVEPGTGALKVGPESARSTPGPVCYDRGGAEPTVTDANVVLGIINPDYFLGGRIKLNGNKAHAAVRDRIAAPMGLDLLAAAAGIFDVASAYMTDLVRLVTIGRGYDPRNCVLFAYGGAGPIHASIYGRQAKEIVVPSSASVHSALGTIVSDVQHVYELSDPMKTPVDPDRVRRHFQALEEQALQDLAKEGFKRDQIVLERYVDMKYSRQVHELRIPVPAGDIVASHMDGAYLEFEKLYERFYGKGAGYKEAGTQIMNFIVHGRGRTW